MAKPKPTTSYNLLPPGVRVTCQVTRGRVGRSRRTSTRTGACTRTQGARWARPDRLATLASSPTHGVRAATLNGMPLYSPTTWMAGLPPLGTEITAVLLNKPETAIRLTQLAVMLAAAANPDSLVTGVVTRDGNNAATAAGITWPDGTTGTYVGTASSAFPGAIDSYVLTYGSSTYTQPTVTRNGVGAVTTRPQIQVT